MQNNLKKVSAKVYLYEKDILIQKITYIYENGAESEPLSRFVHLGMFTDSILFGEECQIRFFVYPFSLHLYDTDVNTLEFINRSDHTVSIFCFGQQVILNPNENKSVINIGNQKYRYTPKDKTE